MIATKDDRRKPERMPRPKKTHTKSPPPLLHTISGHPAGTPTMAIAGAVFLWLSQPPLAWWPVGWIALVSWFVMGGTERGLWRRGYWWLYLAGLGYWLVTLQGLRHAHPAMFLGWFALSLYLAAYPPLAVALIRVGRRRRIPLPVCAAGVWTGLELIRGYAFTGFSANLLGHTQVDHPLVVQIADVFGSYGVSFVVAFVAAAVADGIVQSSALRWSGWAKKAAVPAVLVVATLTYGSWRMEQSQEMKAVRQPLGRIVLIQRNEPVEYVMSREQHEAIFRSYLQGSLEALRGLEDGPADLVVWPESMYSGGSPLMLVGDNLEVPEGMPLSREQLLQTLAVQVEAFREQAAQIQRRLKIAQGHREAPAMLVGCGVLRFDEKEEHYSGAVLIDPHSEVASWYGKRHLVMFGEYVPFAGWMPWLYEVLPISGGVTPGPEPVAMEVEGFSIAPNICFETVVEHVTIGQVRDLVARGDGPDVVINITNDAWFDGSSLLDHHRRCSQMVAIGCRRPVLMASNVGPTVWIDSAGEIVRSVPKQTNGSILARPIPDGRWGLYQAIGDWPARGLAFACLALAIIGIKESRQQRLHRPGERDAPAPAADS